MSTKTTADPAIRARVLRTLAANREYRSHFPGVLMGLSGHREGEHDVMLEFDDGDWCRDAQGEVALPAFGVLLDTALGAVTRLHAGDRRQHATVHLHAQLTGAPMTGHLEAHSHFEGFSLVSALRHGTARAKVICGRTTVAHASGAFVILDLPEGAPQAPPSWTRKAGPAERPADPATLEHHEREVLEACDRALAAVTPGHSFVENFWGGIPERGADSAQLTVPIAPHLGNRVGNVHGGILFGIAAQVADAAVPESMRLSNLSAWFISPGQGSALEVRASVVRAGRSIAVVRTEILGAGGQRVLEVTSQHVATS